MVFSTLYTLSALLPFPPYQLSSSAQFCSDHLLFVLEKEVKEKKILPHEFDGARKKRLGEQEVIIPSCPS